jgi:hypothetical protein
MASNVTATNTCTTTTATGQHAGWGQSVTVSMDGVARTVARPDGWWEEHGDAPWSFTVTFDDPAGVITWTDHEGGATVHGPIVMEAVECAPSTTVAVPTTLAPVVPLPVLVVDPTVVATVPLPGHVADVPSLPVGVEVTAPSVVVVAAPVVAVPRPSPVVTTVAAAVPTLPATGFPAVPVLSGGLAILAVGVWCRRRPRYRHA